MKRSEITEMYYPDKVSVSDFIKIIDTKLGTFESNMLGLNLTMDKYPEEWFRLFGMWMSLYPSREESSDEL